MAIIMEQSHAIHRRIVVIAESPSSHLNFWAPNPAHSRKPFLVQEVVGLVIKAPLAQSKRGTRVLDLLDHLDELGRFVPCVTTGQSTNS